eukprot:COSAG05_NODE_942_length_6503_cov_11.183948_1_plen_62_part_00
MERLGIDPGLRALDDRAKGLVRLAPQRYSLGLSVVFSRSHSVSYETYGATRNRAHFNVYGH